MFTPSMRASSTSLPAIIRLYAFSTQVCEPPFLNQLPFADEMTTGCAAPLGTTAGARPSAPRVAVAAATPAAVPVRTKSRRVIRRRMSSPPVRVVARSLSPDLAGSASRRPLPSPRGAARLMLSLHGADGFRRPRPRGAGDDAPRRVLRFAGGLRARSADHLLPALALRRPGGRSAGARRLRAFRNRGREPHPRPGQGRSAPRFLQRLPAPRDASLRGRLRTLRRRDPV